MISGYNEAFFIGCVLTPVGLLYCVMYCLIIYIYSQKPDPAMTFVAGFNAQVW